MTLEGCVPSMGMPLPGLDDEEGPRVHPDLPFVVDAHVHLFADRLFEAIWRWFGMHGWPIRYKLHAPEVLDFLFSRGVGHVVALHYAHKPGMARAMNTFLAEVARASPRVTAVATVFPGEPGARQILEEGFALGLKGVKLHCHVQSFAPDEEPLHEIYSTCEDHDLPLVIHAGREPRSAAYKVDPHLLCSAERMERVLRDHPKLRVVVPHLGADEFDEYERLLERHDHLWLDTTMMMADYFPDVDPTRMVHARPDRIMYGTDFPNLPYSWDRELRRLARAGVRDATLPALLGGTARALFRIAADQVAAPAASAGKEK